jgi:hypothetical protein
MKRTWIVWTLISALIFLTSCATSPETDASTATEPEPADALAAVPQAGLFEGDLPRETQLMLGTFSLEGTAHRVDAEQAQTLLPLWKAYRSLITSDTAASVEIEALVNQIEGTMTDDQLAAIAAMELSQESFADIMEQLGIEAGSGLGEPPEGFEGFNPGEGIPGGSPGAGGGIPGGGEGGAGRFGGEGLDPEQLATMEASRAGGQGFRNRLSLLLLDPLIEHLEGIAAGGSGL